MELEKIINEYSKLEFEEFCKSGKLPELLTHDGIEILSKSPRRNERIDYILAFSKELRTLFNNDEFVELFLKGDISYYCINIDNLDYESVMSIMNKLTTQNKSNSEIAKIFGYFNENIKKQIIESKTLSTELIYEIFKVGRIPDRNAIINNYDIDLTTHNIDIFNFFYSAKHSSEINKRNRLLNVRQVETTIPTPNMINENLATAIFERYDIFQVRSIIDMMSVVCDSTLVNEYVKYKETEILENSREKLVSPLNEIFEYLSKYIEIRNYLETAENISRDEEEQLWHQAQEYRKLYVTHKYFDRNNLFGMEIEKNIKGGIDAIIPIFERQNSKELSNYIIDYHFEENYHNIKLDIDELLNFYYRGNINIDSEMAGLYQRISNIDMLSIEEKLELHEELKGINMIERFYDDMSFARRIVRESIKDYSLTSESLQQYKDEELSELYGVDVFNVKDEPFFGVVKSGTHAQDQLPTGHSFSLVGNNCVGIFGNPEDANTFLYDVDNLNPNQIVHVFPKDSFTIYKPFEAVEHATTRVNTLLTAPELIDNTSGYNEVLILEHGKTETEMDKDIQTMKRIALYCVDKITEKDIKRANSEGIGILLVSAKSYNHDLTTTDKITRDISTWDYNYFDGYSKKDEYEGRRL